MFLGHFAVALAGKRAAPATSLGTFILAAQLVDLVWPVMLLLGIEHVRVDPGNTAFTPLDFASYPVTHSLLMGLVWGALFGAVYWLARRYPRGAMVTGGLVVSHWILDFITHRPDLPLAPGGDIVSGLGLWNSVPATLAVEGALFAGAVWLYVRTTRAVDPTGRWAFGALVAFLALVYLANVVGPPPPGEREIAVVSLALWFLVPWGYWVDRHRAVRPAEAPARRTPSRPEVEVG